MLVDINQSIASQYKLFGQTEYSLNLVHVNIAGITFWNHRFCIKNIPPPPFGIENWGFEMHNL